MDNQLLQKVLQTWETVKSQGPKQPSTTNDVFEHSFQQQLEVGDKGESDFVISYSDLRPVKSKRDLRFDFTIKDGKTVELKTDFYSMNDTQNYFMEFLSDDSRPDKHGGPFRAKKDGTNYFVYYYYHEKTYHWFAPETLCRAILELHERGMIERRYVWNHGYRTVGYLVPRKLIKDIIIREDVLPVDSGDPGV
jgi:hypothetical protein